MKLRLILFMYANYISLKDLAETLGVSEDVAGKKLLGQALMYDTDIDAFEKKYGHLKGYSLRIFFDSMLDVFAVITGKEEKIMRILETDEDA